jgi:peptide/nickel transport system ATP-binding protein
LIACKPSVHKKGERLPIVSDFLNDDQEKAVGEHYNEAPSQHTDQKLVEVKNLVVEFSIKKGLLGRTVGHVRAVNEVSFDIYKNETLGLVGESGCGKTTLGRTLLRLVEPTAGQIIYNGANITSLEKKGLKELRREVQLVFQDPYSSLNPRLTIGAAIGEPMTIVDHVNDKRERKKRVSELLDMVNLSPGMADRYPHEFSGGQRQRIVIARALSLNPDFLVCDESVSALDVSVQAQVLNLLNDLKRQLGLTMLFISHDLSVVRYMCDRIMVMKQGRIIESGPAEEVYESPKNEYTKALIAAIPAL